MERYKEEFGIEYWLEPALVVALRQEHFEDISWHNDICPSFTYQLSKHHSLRLFVDAIDPDERELPESKRFCLSIEYEDEPMAAFTYETWSDVSQLVSALKLIFYEGAHHGWLSGIHDEAFQKEDVE